MTTTRKFVTDDSNRAHSPDELFTQLVIAMGEVAEAQAAVNKLAHEVVALEAQMTKKGTGGALKKRRLTILRGLKELDQALQGLAAVAHEWHDVIARSLEPTDASPV